MDEYKEEIAVAGGTIGIHANTATVWLVVNGLSCHIGRRGFGKLYTMIKKARPFIRVTSHAHAEAERHRHAVTVANEYADLSGAGKSLIVYSRVYQYVRKNGGKKPTPKIIELIEAENNYDIKKCFCIDGRVTEQTKKGERLKMKAEIANHLTRLTGLPFFVTVSRDGDVISGVAYTGDESVLDSAKLAIDDLAIYGEIAVNCSPYQIGEFEISFILNLLD